MSQTHTGHHRYRRLRAAALDANDTCWLCGKAGADTIDHIIPTSRAPHLAKDPANWRPAHDHCNKARGNGPPPARRTRSRDW